METKYTAKQILQLLRADGKHHKIRSALDSILGYTEILGDSSLSLEQKQIINSILDNTKQVADTVATSQQDNQALPLLAKDIELVHQEVKHSQLMFKALWAAVALLIGWSLASHQFLVRSAEDLFHNKISIVEFRLNDLSEDLHYHDK